MSAYNRESLDNALLHEQLQESLNDQCITLAEFEAAAQKYPRLLYTPGFAIRTGLFILTFFITFASLGFLSMFFLDFIKSFSIASFVFGLITYASLEMMVRAKHHFRSGVDDALIWITFLFIWFAIGPFSFEHNGLSSFASWLLTFALSIYLSIRFVHALMGALACIALIITIYFAYTSLGHLASLTAPFMLAACGWLLYLFIAKKKRTGAWRHYEACMTTAEITLLILIYAACNYYVVREMGNMLLHLQLRDGQPIAFGWVFWIFSTVIPFVYVFYGVRNRNKVLLRTGLILIIALIFTIRNYYHLLPIETAMIMGGIVLIALSYWLINYLLQPKGGFTSAAPVKNDGARQLESLLIAQTFGQVQPVGVNPTSFGGGSGGGGGAGGTY